MEDAAGRKYVFVQVNASAAGNVTFGTALGLKVGSGSFSVGNWTVFHSTEEERSAFKFLGIACNKDANASAGQKLWACYEGLLGLMAESKLKSAQTPITLWASCAGGVASGTLLGLDPGTGILSTAANASTAVGRAFYEDASQKCHQGFIKSPNI
jgi:hypothetical protein